MGDKEILPGNISTLTHIHLKSSFDVLATPDTNFLEVLGIQT